MINLINTPCSRSAWTIDASITAAGWVGFVYLIGNGVMAVVSNTGISVRSSFFVTTLPTVETLMTYATVAAFNALLVVLWASYRNSFFKKLRRQGNSVALDDEAVASHFLVPCNVLHEIQDSRITVIYHADDGSITHLETDQLRVHPTDNIRFLDVAQAA